MLSLIAAVAENHVIGDSNNTQNGLPWHLPDELQYFRTTTKGSTLIMGRKTYEAIGRTLPHRENIIVTSQNNYSVEGAIVVHSLQEAVKNIQSKLAFIIGGRSLYEQALAENLVSTMYLTTVHANADGDVRFPDWNKDDWQCISSQFHDVDANHAHSFTIEVYNKK